jgi:hypothetical protein
LPISHHRHSHRAAPPANLPRNPPMPPRPPTVRLLLSGAPIGHRAGLSECAHGPVVTLCSCCPRVSDRTPRAGTRIDHQLGARGEPPPSEWRAGCSMPLLDTEHTGLGPVAPWRNSPARERSPGAVREPDGIW